LYFNELYLLCFFALVFAFIMSKIASIKASSLAGIHSDR